MFCACKVCHGSGFGSYGLMKNLTVCPNCKGKCIVDEHTGKPFGEVEDEKSIDNDDPGLDIDGLYGAHPMGQPKRRWQSDHSDSDSGNADHHGPDGWTGSGYDDWINYGTD